MEIIQNNQIELSFMTLWTFSFVKSAVHSRASRVAILRRRQNHHAKAAFLAVLLNGIVQLKAVTISHIT